MMIMTQMNTCFTIHDSPLSDKIILTRTEMIGEIFHAEFSNTKTDLFYLLFLSA